MVSVILNEREWAENAIKNPSFDKSNPKGLSMVAKYYYSQGYSKKDIPGMLEDFVLRCNPDANMVAMRELAEKIAKQSDKYELVNISGISITEAEIKLIGLLKSRMAQRLMFTLLCLAKYAHAVNPNRNGWVNRKNRDIFALANIIIASQKQELMLNDLWTLGYIDFSKAINNTSIKVCVMDKSSPEVMFISDFRNLGNQYRRYCGERYIECENCGAVVRKTGRAQKYCSVCARDVNRRKTIETRRKSA